MHLKRTTFCALLLYPVKAQKDLPIASLPAQLTYLLPSPFRGFETLDSDFQGNGSISEGFVDTVVTDDDTKHLLNRAKTSPFVSYSAEFDALLGSTPTLTLIASKDTLFAAEAGAWISGRNEVWFTSSTYAPPTYVTVLSLADRSTRKPAISGVPVVNPNGGIFFNDYVYLTTWGNSTYPGGIVKVNAETGYASNVVNTYFGERLNGPDDLAWAKKGNDEYLYFSDPNYVSALLPGSIAAFLPNTVYRYSPRDHSVVPVVSRADVEAPNGIHVDPSQNILYVTDGPFPSTAGISRGKGTPPIYAFDIMSDGGVVNKTLIGQPRAGIADGLKIDLSGRIWMGEGEGIVVRSSTGQVLGLFNSQAILDPSQSNPIANFALAGDTLVILAGKRLYTVKLAEQVSEMGSTVTQLIHV